MLPLPLVCAAAGLVVGLLLRRRLRAHEHRLPGERGLPPRRFDAVVPASALAWGALAATPLPGGRPAALVAYLAAATILTWLVAVDADVHRLPNAVTLPAHVAVPAALAGCALAGGDPGSLGRALLGGVALAATYAALHLLGRGGALGLGDVKLAGPLGMLLAWPGWTQLVVGAYAVALVSGAVGLWVWHRRGRGARVAHGPAMALGALVGLVSPVVTSLASPVADFSFWT